MGVCMGKCKAGPSKGIGVTQLGRDKVPLVHDIRWEQIVFHPGDPEISSLTHIFFSSVL